MKAKSLSSNDTIHYLWSTIGLPTIVVAHTTDITAHPVINWNNGPNFEIQFVPPVPSMSAFVISNVTEYRDSKDNQDVTANAQIRDVLPKFSWSFKNCHNLTGDGADALFTGTWNTSTMEFAVSAYFVICLDNASLRLLALPNDSQMFPCLKHHSSKEMH